MFGRIATFAMAGMLLAGCQSSTGSYGSVDEDTGTRTSSNTLPQDRARLVAYAATSEYPKSEASSDLKAMAVVNRNKDQITIFNAADRSLRDARVWVNGKFVGTVREIPANGKANVSINDLFDRSGQNLGSLSLPITQVQLQTNDNFYNLQGPVFE